MAVAPHIHVGFFSSLITTAQVVLWIGIFHLLAKRFESHPLSQAFLEIWA